MYGFVDKIGIERYLASKSHGKIALDIGCGPNKKNSEALGIDSLDYPGVDLVGDVFAVLKAFPDKAVDSVYTSHFVEHLVELEPLLAELYRVVKVGGIIEIIAPHFSNPYFYSDPTHKLFFGLYTFCYYAKQSPFSRIVPTYQKKPYFSIDKIELRFKSTRPFYVRHFLKRTFGFIFNSCYYLREFYEENWCYVVPCYEIHYSLKRVNDC